MGKIRLKDTKSERILRSYLFREGLRFRLHRKDLPGKPDIVFPKFKTVIFVHGCFWHYHADCREGRIPSTNSNFWRTKLSKNVLRDESNIAMLQNMNWNVIVVWECKLQGRELKNTIIDVVRQLKKNGKAKRIIIKGN